MSKEQKEKKETPKTESNKSLKIVVLVLLVVVTGLAAAYFFMNDNQKVVPQEPVQIIEEEKVEIMDTIEVVQEDTTTVIEADIEEVVEEIQDQPVSKPKKKRIDYNNSPKYWNILLVNNQDTSYYVIKNRVSGLTLSNRYYSKSEAEKELQNFKKIIQ